jgi:hypothetical protein
MERNRWETAIRCLEVAVHPNTREDQVVAAIDGFRRTVEGTPVSRVCIEFACGGVPLSELAEMKATIERLDRENRALRRGLAVEEAAQAEAAGRLDNAYRRIYELTEEAAAAQRRVETAEQGFADFRETHAQVLKSAPAKYDSASSIRKPAMQRHPFSAVLTEARLAADRAASFAGAGSGSGRIAADTSDGKHSGAT